MSRIPLISPSRTAMAGALVLLAIALPAAAHFQSAGPVPADTESDRQAVSRGVLLMRAIILVVCLLALGCRS